MSTSATLWPWGTLSTSVRPQGNWVPAGRPPSLATIATLSRSCIVMYSGEAVEPVSAMLGTPVSGSRGLRSVQSDRSRATKLLRGSGFAGPQQEPPRGAATARERGGNISVGRDLPDFDHFLPA